MESRLLASHHSAALGSKLWAWRRHHPEAAWRLVCRSDKQVQQPNNVQSHVLMLPPLYPHPLDNTGIVVAVMLIPQVWPSAATGNPVASPPTSCHSLTDPPFCRALLFMVAIPSRCRAWHTHNLLACHPCTGSMPPYSPSSSTPSSAQHHSSRLAQSLWWVIGYSSATSPNACRGSQSVHTTHCRCLCSPTLLSRSLA